MKNRIIKKKGFMMLELLLVIGLMSSIFVLYYNGVYKIQKASLEYQQSLKYELNLRNFTKLYINSAAKFNINKAINKNVSEQISLEPLATAISSDRNTFYLSKKLIDTNINLQSQLKLLKCKQRGNAKAMDKNNEYFYKYLFQIQCSI
jgi:superfamily II helicase